MAPVLALAVAVLVRAPRFDVAWFGVDQVFFMIQARRVLAGDWNVTGPLASGLNIVGPLYSYLLAGLLWIRDDPAFAASATMWLGVIATVFVFDAARRMTSDGPALVAALSYAVAPALVEGTRLVWNPSMLPPLLAIGWWMAVRYVQAPSVSWSAGTGFVAGAAVPMHITGVFGAIGMAAAAILCQRPRLLHAVAGLVAFHVPMAPGLIRVTQTPADAANLGARLGSSDWASTLEAITITVLQLPSRVWLEEWHWSVGTSVQALQWQVVAAAAGAVIAMWRGYGSRAVWFGIALSVILHVVGTRMYGGTLDWYYFLALIPPLCLLLAPVAAAIPRNWIAAVALTLWTIGIAAQVTFVYQFDTRAMARGLITVDESRLGVRLSRSIAHSVPLQDLRTIAEGLARFVPDGATALASTHGGRGELWREAGAEFLPGGSPPATPSAWQFIMMGPGAEAIAPTARILPGHVCASIRPEMEWRMQHPPVAPGWDAPSFDDSLWHAIPVPRRTPRSAPGGFAPVMSWRAPRMMARGRLMVFAPRSPHFLAVAVRGARIPGRSLQGFVNGRPVRAMHRAMHSSIAATDEWLLDITEAVSTGRNSIALLVDGVTTEFDFDVFDVPCVDDEWYHASE